MSKKNIFFAFPFLLILLMPMCTYEKSKNELPSKIELSEGEMKLSLLSRDFEIWNYSGTLSSRENSATMSRWTSAEISQQSLQAIVELLKTEFEGYFDQYSMNTLAMAIYVSNVNMPLSSQNITGVSMIYLDNDNNIIHEFSKNQNNFFIKDINICGKFKAYSSVDFKLMTLIADNNSTTNNSGYTLLTSPEFDTSFKLSKSNGSLGRLVFNNADLIYVGRGPTYECAPCLDESGACVKEEVSDGQGGTFTETTCDQCAARTVITHAMKQYSYNIDLETLFPSSFCYWFRDEFLNSYTKGQQYISRYYAISYFLRNSNALTLDNLPNHISLISKGLIIAKRLRGDFGDEAVIVDQ